VNHRCRRCDSQPDRCAVCLRGRWAEDLSFSYRRLVVPRTRERSFSHEKAGLDQGHELGRDRLKWRRRGINLTVLSVLYWGHHRGVFHVPRNCDLYRVDDLTKHAIGYREMCLLLRRPRAREAYPGDLEPGLVRFGPLCLGSRPICRGPVTSPMNNLGQLIHQAHTSGGLSSQRYPNR
jgi:hypothetical protein